MFDLERFVKAQENTYDTALKEIQNGQKETPVSYTHLTKYAIIVL